MKKINLNNKIKVQLNERGQEMYIHYYDYVLNLEDAHLSRSKDIDENGFVEMQLWRFIQMFGETISVGADLPFSTDIYIRDEDVKNVEGHNK